MKLTVDEHMKTVKQKFYQSSSGNAENVRTTSGNVIELVDHIVQTGGTLDLIDMLPCGVSISTDLSCKTILHNTMAARFLRVGKWDNLSHSAEVPPSVEIFKNGQKITVTDMPIQWAAWTGENVVGSELEFLWPDGVRRYGLWSARPLYKNGLISGAIATCEDITARKLLEFEMLEYRVNLQKHQNAMHLGMNQILLSALTSNTEEELGESCLGILAEITRSKFGFIGKINSAGMLGDLAISNPDGDVCEISEKTGYRMVPEGFKEHDLYGRVLLKGKGIFTNNPNSYPDSSGLPKGHPPLQSFLGVPLILDEKISGMIVMGNRDGGYRKEDLQTVQAMANTIVQAFTHKQTHQALLQKNNEIHTILSSITDAFYALDNKWCFTLINPSAARINTRLKPELIGQNFWQVFPELARSELYQKFHQACTTKVPIDVIMQALQSDRWLEVNIYPHDAGILVSYKDITERVMYEKKLARLERLNIIGEMAAGIGHEVRNPMTTVRGYLQMFQRKSDFEEYRTQLDTMIGELDRANGIITDFLSLAKDRRVDLVPGNLKDIVNMLFPILQADAFLLGHEIQLDLGDIPIIYYDDKDMRQLILNLVRNGLEAMESSGIVTIKTYLDNEKIILAVQDTGSGIPQEIQDKIGTPFITTKDFGTGLGLSICYRISERHGAKIEFETSSAGTTFFIQFSAM